MTFSVAFKVGLKGGKPLSRLIAHFDLCYIHSDITQSPLTVEVRIRIGPKQKQNVHFRPSQARKKLKQKINEIKALMSWSSWARPSLQ